MDLDERLKRIDRNALIVAAIIVSLSVVCFVTTFVHC